MGAVFAAGGVFDISVGGARWVRSRRAARPFEQARQGSGTGTGQP
jgi:hypothetical protein